MLHRHDLLLVDAEVWAEVVARVPLAPAVERLVTGWAGRGWPVIGRRRLPGDPADGIPVGLPLPPSHRKLRLTFSLPRDAPGRRRAPVTLSEALATAPPAWRPVGHDLVESGGTAPRVFGALLWQHLTGLPYLGPRSDLDLLWSATDRDAATALVTRLARLDGAGPVRLDGEVELGDGGAVHWRELAHALDRPRAEVLVKRIDGVELRPLDRLFTAGVRA